MTESNVIYPNFITSLDLPAERVLTAALEAELTDVVIAGYDKDGDEYFASSVADGGSTLWLIERLKKMLLETPDGA